MHFASRCYENIYEVMFEKPLIKSCCSILFFKRHLCTISCSAGNKSDLHPQRQVLFEDACTLAEKSALLAALETSAKESQNIDAAFILMARELLARNGMTIADQTSQCSPQFTLSDSSQPIYGAAASSDKKCEC